MISSMMTRSRCLRTGCLSPSHAVQFRAFIKQRESKYQLDSIIDGNVKWPRDPKDRDLLYFLAQSLRAHLVKGLPEEREKANAEARRLAHRGKALLTDLASISLEIAQMVVAKEGEHQVPNWFLVEIVRDLPRLVVKKEEKK